MGERFMRLLPSMAVVLVGLLLGTCVTALAAVGSPPASACGPGTTEEIGSVKAPLLGLWALAEPTIILPTGLFSYTRLRSPVPSPLRLDVLWGDFVSRAPPLS